MTSTENIARWTAPRDDEYLIQQILRAVDGIESDAGGLGENFPYDLVSMACEEIRGVITDTEIVDADDDENER
jgi:hypothetical protein